MFYLIMIVASTAIRNDAEIDAHINDVDGDGYCCCCCYLQNDKKMYDADDHDYCNQFCFVGDFDCRYYYCNCCCCCL